MGLLDNISQMFVVLAAGLGAVAALFFKLWQGAKERERDAEAAKEKWVGVIKRERESREAAQKALQEAEQQEEEAVEEVRKGRRDHFTKQ